MKIWLAPLLLLAACSSTDSNRVTDAATTPLNDLNLVSAPIPQVLKDAKNGPYLAPVDQTCPGLLSATQALDAVLGPDLDAPARSDNLGLVARGSDAAGDAAIGALKGAAEGVMPFRSWVRKLSGAERYSKEVAAAIAAGAARRGYLRGLRAARGCA